MGGVLEFEASVQEYLCHLGVVGALIPAKDFSTVRDSNVGVVRKRKLLYTLCKGTESVLGLYRASGGRGFVTQSCMLKEQKAKLLIQEKTASTAIKNYIAQLYHWRGGEDVIYQLGYMESKFFVQQRPHCDYQNRALAGKQAALAFLPLTAVGMYLQVWDENLSLMGFVLYVPFGSMLVLWGNVIHGGGFMSDKKGNPRLHMYVKFKGDSFALDPNNDYEVAENLRLQLNTHVLDPFGNKES